MGILSRLELFAWLIAVIDRVLSLLCHLLRLTTIAKLTKNTFPKKKSLVAIATFQFATKPFAGLRLNTTFLAWWE